MHERHSGRVDEVHLWLPRYRFAQSATAPTKMMAQLRRRNTYQSMRYLHSFCRRLSRDGTNVSVVVVVVVAAPYLQPGKDWTKRLLPTDSSGLVTAQLLDTTIYMWLQVKALEVLLGAQM